MRFCSSAFFCLSVRNTCSNHYLSKIFVASCSDKGSLNALDFLDMLLDNNSSISLSLIYSSSYLTFPSLILSFYIISLYISLTLFELIFLSYFYPLADDFSEHSFVDIDYLLLASFSNLSKQCFYFFLLNFLDFYFDRDLYSFCNRKSFVYFL
jgi:hypothetical protein